VYEIMQHNDITSVLMVFRSIHWYGRMERWNAGIWEIRAEINYLNCQKNPSTHHSITSLLHYSNWGEDPNLYEVVEQCEVWY
jgi:hypothetical protein